jgi:hypothetical protein
MSSDEEESTELKSFTLVEYPNAEVVSKIYRHPDIIDEDRKRFRKYADKAKYGKVNIKYSMKHKYGRYYPVDYSMLCANSMWRRARASLFSESEYDVDIKSCHFAILVNEVYLDLSMDHLKFFINNKDEVFSQFTISEDNIKSYNVTNNTDYTKKDVLKKLFTRHLYGGLFENWLKEFDMTRSDVTLPQLYYNILSDIEMGIQVLLHKQKSLFKDIKRSLLLQVQQKWDTDQCNRTDKRTKKQEFNPTDHVIKRSSLLACFFQDRERLIIEDTHDFIMKQFGIAPTAYCFDGFQVKKQDVPDVDYFLNKINDNTYVTFEIKQFANPLSSTYMKEKNYFDENEFYMISDEKERRKYFERYYFKILSMEGFSYFDNDGKVKRVRNERFHFGKIYGDFLEFYSQSLGIPTYVSFGIYPCRELCPERILNTWTGFLVEEYTDIEPDGDISKILYHFKVVSNFEDPVYEYLLNYFAWLVQKPHQKTNVCLLIKGLQGCGKNTLVENLLKAIMGKKYIFDTADVDKICGRFNDVVQGKLMGILNEVSGKDTMGVVDKIKDSITREDVLIEQKGIDSVSIKDYCNFCYTTNNINPVRIDKDDRRFMVVECSSKHKGDVKYFELLRADIGDKKIIKTFYNFLMQRDITRFNCERDRVITEAAQDMHVLNQCTVEKFINYLHSDEYTKYTQEYRASELYSDYKKFMFNNGYTNIVNISTFGQVMKQKADGRFETKRMKYGMRYTFNWEVECQI